MSGMIIMEEIAETHEEVLEVALFGAANSTAGQ